MSAEHEWLEGNMIHGGGGGGGSGRDGWREGCFWKILRNMVFGSWMVVVPHNGVVVGWCTLEDHWLGCC